jgi:hypothetical protein
MSRAVPFLRRVVLGLVVIGALVTGFHSAAVAHSELGLMTLDAAAGREALSADLRARVVYANDREPASSATVLVSGVGPAGAVLPASPMTGGADGVYTAAVLLPGPGTWSFRATATTPEAAAETTFTAAAPPAPTSVPTGGSERATGRSTATNDADANGGSGWAVPAIAIAVVLVVIAAVAVTVGRHLRSARAGVG